MNSIETNPKTLIAERSRVLFAKHQQTIFKHTDNLFALLMIFQWLGAVIAALTVSPRTWSGPMSQTHLHVWTALILGGVITFYPVFLALTQTGKTFTRHAIGVGQILMSALLIHLTGGRIETHFHVFGSLAFLSFYRDWKVLIPATVVIAADHWIRGVYWPQSVFGILTASPYRWIEHAGWVIFEDMFLITASLRSVREMSSIAERTAELEASHQALETEKENLETEMMKRKQAEEEIRGSEEKIRAFVETARDAIISADGNGRIISWNKGAESAFGYTEKEAAGKPLTLIMPERFHDGHKKGFARFLATKEPHVIGKTVELSGLKKDGTDFPVEISLSAWTAKEGIFFTAIIRDITERKRNEEALKNANEELTANGEKLIKTIAELERTHSGLKEAQTRLIDAEKAHVLAQLAVGVAHEIKNPLGILLQGIHYVNKHVKSSDKNVPWLLEDMTQAVKRADYVVKGLLDLGRPASLEVKLEDLDSIIENVLLLLKHHLDMRQIRVTRTFDRNIPNMLLDRGKMISLFVNLISNAADAMPEGGPILVTAALEKLTEIGRGVGRRKEDIFRLGQDVAVVKVEDTGTGIPEDILADVFEPFFTTKRGKGGTGLGLSVAKSIVLTHRGTIEIENRKEGGTRVTVRLPVPSGKG